MSAPSPSNTHSIILGNFDDLPDSFTPPGDPKITPLGYESGGSPRDTSVQHTQVEYLQCPVSFEPCHEEDQFISEMIQNYLNQQNMLQQNDTENGPALLPSSSLSLSSSSPPSPSSLPSCSSPGPLPAQCNNDAFVRILIDELASAKRQIQFLKRQSSESDNRVLIPQVVRSARFQAARSAELLTQTLHQRESTWREIEVLRVENDQMSQELEALRAELEVKNNLVKDWQQNFDRTSRTLEELKKQLQARESIWRDYLSHSSSESLFPSTTGNPMGLPPELLQSPFSLLKSTSRETLSDPESPRAARCSPTTSHVLSLPQQNSKLWGNNSRKSMSHETLYPEIDRLRDSVKAYERQNTLMTEEIIRLQGELTRIPLDPCILDATKAALRFAEKLNLKAATESLPEHFLKEKKLLAKAYFWTICANIKLSYSLKGIHLHLQPEEIYPQLKHLSFSAWEKLLQVYVSLKDVPNLAST